MQDVLRAQERALSSCGRDLGCELGVAVDKTRLGGGARLAGLGCPGRMFGLEPARLGGCSSLLR